MKPTSQGGAPPHLSVVVPVKNEAGNIALLIGEIARALADRAPFEVIFVDDGSTDATAAMLKAEQAERPWLRVLHHAASSGQSAAVRSGVRVRGHGLLVSAEDVGTSGVQAVIRVTIEIEGGDKPACVADAIVRFFPGRSR